MEPLSPISDWKRPLMFDDSYVIDKDSLTKHKGTGYTFDCVLCGEQCKKMTSKSLYNNTSRICQYCHHAEYIMVEHILMRNKTGRTGHRTDAGMDVIPTLGPKPDEVVMSYRTKEFSDAWNGVVTAEPVKTSGGIMSNPERHISGKIIEFQNGRPRWETWRKAVLYFSRINEVFAWLTDASKWISVQNKMASRFESYKEKNTPRSWKAWRKAANQYGNAKDQYLKSYSDMKYDDVEK